jgi:hypothetical protein
MKRIFLAVLALFSLTAFASPGNDGCVGNCSPSGQNPNVSVDTRNNALAFVSSNTSLGVNVLPAAVTVQPANVTVQPAGQPVTVNNTLPATQSAPPVVNNNFPAAAPQPTTVKVLAAPSVYAGNVYPTTSCAHSANAGASGLGWGVSFGGSYLDDECGVRETARSFQNMDRPGDALVVLCSSKYAAVAPSCKAMKPEVTLQ